MLFIGTGTIGKPLIWLFLKKARELDLKIMFHKNLAEERCVGMLKNFMEAGAQLVVYREKFVDFEKLLKPYGLRPHLVLEDALEQTDVVIDCTEKEIAFELKKKYYDHFPNILGFIAQGSATGFGKPYAFDINDGMLTHGQDRFVQVVSCNTHNGLRILKTLVFDPDDRDIHNIGHWDFDNLVRARFYLARRGADISQSKIVVGPEAGAPTDPEFGSHQGADITRVISTFFGFKPPTLDLHTVADKYSHPYMHVVNFDVALREQVTMQEVISRFKYNHLTATTFEREVHRVFSEGREFGHFGRIFNQTIVCLPTLEVIRDGHEVIGRCFTPQDGNALLSSVAAALWFKYPDTYKQIVRNHFYKLPFLFDIV